MQRKEYDWSNRRKQGGESMEDDNGRVTMAVLKQTILETSGKVDDLAEKLDRALALYDVRERDLVSRVTRNEIRIERTQDEIKDLSNRSNVIDGVVAVAATIAAFLGITR